MNSSRRANLRSSRGTLYRGVLKYKLVLGGQNPRRGESPFTPKCSLCYHSDH